MYACTENNEQITDKDVKTENCDERINSISGDIVEEMGNEDPVCEPEEITGIRFSADVYVENYLYIGDSWRIATNNKGKIKKLIFEYSDDGINWNAAFPLMRGR